MNRIERILEKRWKYHAVIWLLALIVVLFFMTSVSTNFTEKVLDSIVILVPTICLAYALFFLQDYFFSKKQYLVFFIIAAALTVASAYMAIYLSAFLFQSGTEGMDRHQWIQNMSFLSILMLVSRSAKKGLVSQMKLQKLEVEKLKMELHLLKTQLNPHFLFNTINNICGVNQINADNGTEMLINLADLMRYHLEFSAANSIAISKEIQLIKAYIALEKMRLRDNCTVTFDFPTGNIENTIAPLLLLPFIENAFKHGTHTYKSCFVDISLTHKENQLKLRVRNSVFKNKKISKNNIGQLNTIKRLKIIYAKNHQLNISEKDCIYLVELSIDL